MLFNSLSFVIFLAVVYTAYLVLHHRAQNYWLLGASYFFYGCWNWQMLSLIFLTTAVDFLCSNAIYRNPARGRRRLFLWLSILSNLSILGFFKYFNFFAESAVELLHLLGMKADPLTLKVLLPVGISFYTFQSMSYTIDVYRGSLKPTRNFLDYALFVSLFPQLVAGPIERASHLLPQVERPRSITSEYIREGFWLILLGYFKKVVVADNVASIANAVFNAPDQYSGWGTLLGIYAFAFQIYGDFSGYSDIARGVARLMGFDIMLNFRMPYFAHNPKEFWQRWHISLSTWLRDYLYIPLGGNRKGSIKTCRNLSVTMLLGGLWHGAAWNYVLWGAYQGLLLIVHRVTLGRLAMEPKANRWLKPFKILVMFQFICFGWILFRINHIADLPILVNHLFSKGTAPLHWVPAMLFWLSPLLLLQFLKEGAGDMMIVKRLPAVERLIIYAVLFGYICVAGKVDGFEFIYFQF